MSIEIQMQKSKIQFINNFYYVHWHNNVLCAFTRYYELILTNVKNDAQLMILFECNGEFCEK